MMTKQKFEDLKSAAREQIAKAKQLVEANANAGKADNEWSAPDRAAYEAAVSKGRDLVEQIKTAKADLAVWDNLKSLAGELGDPRKPVDGKEDSGQRLSFKATGTAAATKITSQLGGQKALAANLATVVGQEFMANPIELGKVANSLLSILPVYPHTSPEFSYLTQTARTNNAAVVADGAEKPESVYTLVRKEASLKVIAHISEPISKYWLVDNGSLEQFVANELEYGLGRAVEAKVLADINAASGIQTQTYSTSALQTLRKCLTKLQSAGLDAAGIVLNPTDWEGIELALSTTTAVEYRGLPYDPVARRLWGVPVVLNLTQVAGTGHVIAKESIGLNTDGSVDIEWADNNEDDFTKNLLRCRAEGRFETSVFRPLGVVKATLTGA